MANETQFLWNVQAVEKREKQKQNWKLQVPSYVHAFFVVGLELVILVSAVFLFVFQDVIMLDTHAMTAIIW